MTFVMQVRFTESQSYLPPLPGDLLLIFAKDDWGDELHFEWQSIDISECELAAAEDCYPPSWKFLKAFGRSFQLKRSYAGIDELYKKPSVLTSDLFIRRSRAPIEEGPARGVFYLYVNPVLFIDPDPKFPFLNMRTLPRERELDSEDFRFLLRQGMTLEVWMDIHRQISWRLWS